MATGEPSQQRFSSEMPKPKARRRMSHVTKACNGCRRRKMKCDGGQPTCGICKVYAEDCVYKSDGDGRRATPKAYVTALEERVRILERKLATHGIDADGDGEPERDPESDEAGLDRLKLDEATGQLLEHGPTSVFKHTDSDRRTSPSVAPVFALGGYIASLVSADLGSPELDPETHEEVLRLFFNYFNPQSCWVNERQFRRDMLAAPQVEGTVIRSCRTPYYSPLLHNMVLAVGVAFLQGDQDMRDKVGNAFTVRAKALLEEESEAAMLSTVSGVFLMGTYYASVARQNLGFIYCGMGLRIAQALGLGTNCSYWVKKGTITEETKRDRYHLFYTGYILDKLWSIYVGRAASLSIAHCDIPIPEPDPDEDDVPWQPMVQPRRRESFDPQINQAAQELSKAIASVSTEPVKGWRSTTWVWTCKLSVIAERVLGTVYSIRFSTSASNVQHVVSEIDVQLEKWLESLPEPLRLPTGTRTDLPRAIPSHILNLHSYYCFTVILLHRPWFTRRSKQGDEKLAKLAEASVGKCEKAAVKVLQILALYQRCPGLRYCPITLGQVAFSAGTVHLLSATHATAAKRPNCVDAVRTCISALEEMGDALKCAAVSGTTLQRLLDQAEAEWNGTAGAPTRPAETDLERMLRDPNVAEQLQRLGWVPPSGVSPQATSTTAVPLTGTQPASESPLVWSIFAPLNIVSSPGTTIPPQLFAPPSALASLSPPPVVPGAISSPTGTSNLFDVLCSSQANGGLPAAFPEGNSWSWPFGYGDGDV